MGRLPRLAAALALLAAASACGDAGPQAGLSRGSGSPRGSTSGMAPAATAAPEGPPVEAPSAPLVGCPPPPRPPTPPGATPPGPVYVPPVLVHEEALPEPLPPGAWQTDTRPLSGKGMWIWKYFQSEKGDPDAIVKRAADAGIRQLWVRVGDSKDGFYAADVLKGLVPKAHAEGIAVIGWGFPFLFDPVADAGWSADALAWRSPQGDALDGFSPDLELSTEGVVLTPRRAEVYLGLVRRAAGNRLVAATVYRPSDRLWPDAYPYAAIAAYVDAFAPMVYWGCLEPGALARQSLERLATLRPVHVIGQAYDQIDEGGRGAPPDAHETRRFLDVSFRGGALGASFWVWQSIGPEQWGALSDFPWPAAGYTLPGAATRR